MVPYYGMSSFNFTVRINSKSSPGLYMRTKKTFSARISARLRYDITYVQSVARLRCQITARSSNKITQNWVNARKSRLK